MKEIIVANKIALQSTFKPDCYYFWLSDLPNSIQRRILDDGLNYRNDSYTVWSNCAYLSGVIQVNGDWYDYEVTIAFDQNREIPDEDFEDYAEDILGCIEIPNDLSIYITRRD